MLKFINNRRFSQTLKGKEPFKTNISEESTPNDFYLFKYTPITSVDVDIMSFSMYKNILLENL